MSITLYRLPYRDPDIGHRQQWFASQSKAEAGARFIRLTDPNSSAGAIEAMIVPTGARQLCDWLNRHCTKFEG